MKKENKIKLAIAVVMLFCCIGSYVVTYASAWKEETKNRDTAITEGQIINVYTVGYEYEIPEKESGKDSLVFYRITGDFEVSAYAKRCKPTKCDIVIRYYARMYGIDFCQYGNDRIR